MSMQGKVVVVTGSNIGIGLETAVGVAERGATTVLACRNQAKAEAAAKEVTQRTWNDDVHVVPLDLADLASVRKAADDTLSRWGRLDVLVNNAGGTWTQRQHTAQGIEYTFGVNHLGHFYLTNLLLDRRIPVQRAGTCRRQPRRRSAITPPSRACASTTCRARSATEGTLGGVLPLQAGQRALHPPRAGQAPRGQRRRDRQRGASRAGAQRLRHGRRPDGGHGLWHATGDRPFEISTADAPAPRRRSTLRRHQRWPARRACTGCVPSRAI